MLVNSTYKRYVDYDKEKVLAQENYDKPLCKVYKYPIYQTILHKEEDLGAKAELNGKQRETKPFISKKALWQWIT